MAIDGKIDRREFFAGVATLAVGSAQAFAGRAEAHADLMAANFVSAVRIGDSDGGIIIGARGVAGFSLPGRGHGAVHLRANTIVLVGRRPGSYAAIVDLGAVDVEPNVFHPLKGHRFAGHAALSPDGTMLATSEIDAGTGDGIVVMRDAQTGIAHASFAVGIEPHDLLFAKGGSRLIVAIGGIARAADVKGPAINIGNIESAIVELDPSSGTVLKTYRLPPSMNSLSMRHMAMAPGGDTIVFGMQDQDRSQLRPLMGRLQLGSGIDLFPLPEGDSGAMRAYIGSVAVDKSGSFVAATSPKGGMIGLWSLAEGRWLGGQSIQDVCGLSADAGVGCFWATSGLGDIVKLAAAREGLRAVTRWQAPFAFDNHLLRI